MSNNFCSKLQLVKPPGRLIGTHYRREVLYNWLIELKITCGMKSIASPIVENCIIYTVNTPQHQTPRSSRQNLFRPEGFILEKTDRLTLLSC